MIKFITQSFMKDMREFMEGMLCGNIVRERWINDRLLDDPDNEPGAMELGSYFEYIFTEKLLGKGKGNLPKNKKRPRPIFYKNIQERYNRLSEKQKDNFKFNPEADGVLLAPYKYAHQQANRLEESFKKLGFKVLRAGKEITKGLHRGTIDLMIECTKNIIVDGKIVLKKGERFVLDLKYSAWLKDTVSGFNKHGWKWTPIQKKYHGTQAIQYHYITGLRFIFGVVAAAEDGDMKFFDVPVDEAMINAHLAEGLMHKDKLEFYSKTGLLEARPNFKTCNNCALRNECKDRQTTPQIETIDLYETV